MAGEWRDAELQEIAATTDRAFAMGPFGSNIKAENYRDSGVPVIRGTNLREVGDAPFVAEDFVFLDEEKADELASSNCFLGDIVFVAQGTVGKVGIVPANTPYNRFVLSQNLMKVTVDPIRADPRFVFYFYRSEVGQHEIMSRVNPTGVPCISKPLTSLRQFAIRLPVDVNEQRAIAHILGTLDDKIELNRQTNQTLEAIARALFKSWFIDFHPTRAKAAGNDPNLPKPLADLFPDSFQDSELGEIPKGWEVWRVGDIGSVICGKTPSTQISDYYGFDVPFITIPDMHGKIFATTTQKCLSHAGAASQPKKLLPPGAICVSCIATPGLVVITSEAAQTNQQINSVVPWNLNETYLWYWSLRDLGNEIRAGGSGGSVLTNLSTGRFAELLVLAPPTILRSAYQSSVSPIFARVLTNERESRTLAALRDTLLPKLISGELRIKNPDRFCERAI